MTKCHLIPPRLPLIRGGREGLSFGFLILIMLFPQNPEYLTDFEKQHVPALMLLGSQIKVSVGEKLHVMEPEHYIEWIALYDDKKCLAKVVLNPAQRPEIVFNIGGRLGFFTSRARCSQHGTWQSGWT